ncbi:MAG: putative sugar nucleotidyl transferase, partial [Gemmataceae bacterium]|nr:putative sugar nucleotidyl transferase [Gemmataceae bacterium]
MRICLFDSGWDLLQPLTWTRPVFELLCGMTTLGEKQRRWWDSEDWGVCLRPELAAIYRRDHPQTPINEYGWLLTPMTVIVDGRWLPPPRRSIPWPTEPCLGLANGQIVWLVLGKEQLADVSVADPSAVLASWRHRLPAVEVGGCLIEFPWQLVEHNGTALREDYAYAASSASRLNFQTLPAIVGCTDQVQIAPTARIDPYVVIDVTQGPVVIAEHAVVTAFSRLEGPCYIGPYTHVLGAKIRGSTTLGQHCRVGGEIEASIMHGYSNKYHDGFLGHSYVGEWVNLGAGTHNSDLRNDYGPVSVPMSGGLVATGLTKVGCFLGDHVRTGLGTLLNTGAHVGPFAHLLPNGRLAPKFVPAFSAWWNGELREVFSLEQLLASA